jgi:hypothetical protein
MNNADQMLESDFAQSSLCIVRCTTIAPYEATVEAVKLTVIVLA